MRECSQSIMTTIHKTALVFHTPDKMYKLINEVENYPDFLPWCKSSKIIDRSECSQRAKLEIAKGPINKSFTTRNTMQVDKSIKLCLEDGPFKSLDGEWTFKALGDKGCKITLDITFEFSNSLVAAVLNPVFSEICNSLVDAFVKQADSVYKEMPCTSK